MKVFLKKKNLCNVKLDLKFQSAWNVYNTVDDAGS